MNNRTLETHLETPDDECAAGDANRNRRVVVISTPLRMDPHLGGLLPAGWLARAEANGRVYRLYLTTWPARPDVEYRGLDDQLLTAVKSFATEADAQAWVARDAAERRRLGFQA